MAEDDLAHLDPETWHGAIQPPAAKHLWWQSATNWLDMILRPDIEVCEADEDHPAKDGCGIYVLFNDYGLEYIGKTSDLHARLLQHWYAGQFGRAPRYSHYACLPLPPYAVDDVEIAHIHALSPPRNKLFAPARWAQHSAMVKHIQEIWGPKR